MLQFYKKQKKKRFQLKIKEAIHIQWEKPTLNHQLDFKVFFHISTLSCFLLFS